MVSRTVRHLASGQGDHRESHVSLGSPDSPCSTGQEGGEGEVRSYPVVTHCPGLQVAEWAPDLIFKRMLWG